MSSYRISVYSWYATIISSYASLPPLDPWQWIFKGRNHASIVFVFQAFHSFPCLLCWAKRNGILDLECCRKRGEKAMVRITHRLEPRIPLETIHTHQLTRSERTDTGLAQDPLEHGNLCLWAIDYLPPSFHKSLQEKKWFYSNIPKPFSLHYFPHFATNDRIRRGSVYTHNGR